MKTSHDRQPRHAPVDMSAEEFRSAGHKVIDDLADFLATLPQRPVSPNETPTQVREALGLHALPESGAPAADLLAGLVPKLADHSVFNSHPSFWGYITSPPTPIGALGDLIAAVLNPNVGPWKLSPIATEIEAQTVRWIAELIGYPTDSGGVLGSGGNVANFIGFLAARRARLPWDVRKEGVRAGTGMPVVYASAETHTWLHKAADLFGLGLDAVRWIPTDDSQRMRPDALEQALAEDRAAENFPFVVIASAGTVSTGVVDPIARIADLCAEHELWLHVDGAYGALAAALPEASDDLKALSRADSVAVDPHKWLYSPLEAGCTLVRDKQHLIDAFSFHPEYYRFDTGEEDPGINFFEFGLQNSRGFRALKVWLALKQAGRSGVVDMIRDDISLSRAMFEAVQQHPELEAITQELSIATFRYVPPDASEGEEEYLNELNTEVLERLQAGGKAYVSNAIIDGRFALRACIVNFRTTLDDVLALPDLVSSLGREIHQEFRSSNR